MSTEKATSATRSCRMRSSGGIMSTMPKISLLCGVTGTYRVVAWLPEDCCKDSSEEALRVEDEGPGFEGWGTPIGGWAKPKLLVWPLAWLVWVSRWLRLKVGGRDDKARRSDAQSESIIINSVPSISFSSSDSDISTFLNGSDISWFKADSHTRRHG